MDKTSANNKRIAKNTLLLYIRMIVIMLVTLYTSRVVLDALGESDYGIYSVVGGVVAMFSVLSGSLSSAISRFITYALGTGDRTRLGRIFSTSVNVQLLMALAIFVLCEIAGVWFLNEKMNIPEGRMDAANFVLQCSIATFMVNLVSVPYSAMIIAHERMGVFAYIGILEALLKLSVAWLIYSSAYDKLFVYAALILGVSVLLRVVYGLYCSRHFEAARYRFVLDKPLLKEMAGFAGWNMFGNMAYMLGTQGVNMLMNVFFGVTANAARAIAVQVDTAVTRFVDNFMLALNPQITKSYASGDRASLFKLVFRGTKYSFFIMYLFIVPLVLEADTVLGIWLKEVPADAVVFTRLVLFSTLMTLLGNAMLTAILATGRIRGYQMAATSFACLVFPLTWLAYRWGCPAYATYVIYILVYFSLNFVRILFLKRLTDFPVRRFLRAVFGRVGLCAVSAFVVPSLCVLGLRPSFSRLLLVCVVSLAWSLLCIYCLGLEKRERTFFVSKAKALWGRYVMRSR